MNRRVMFALIQFPQEELLNGLRRFGAGGSLEVISVIEAQAGSGDYFVPLLFSVEAKNEETTILNMYVRSHFPGANPIGFWLAPAPDQFLVSLPPDVRDPLLKYQAVRREMEGVMEALPSTELLANMSDIAFDCVPQKWVFIKP